MKERERERESNLVIELLSRSLITNDAPDDDDDEQVRATITYTT